MGEIALTSQPIVQEYRPVFVRDSLIDEDSPGKFISVTWITAAWNIAQVEISAMLAVRFAPN